MKAFQNWNWAYLTKKKKKKKKTLLHVPAKNDAGRKNMVGRVGGDRRPGTSRPSNSYWRTRWVITSTKIQFKSLQMIGLPITESNLLLNFVTRVLITARYKLDNLVKARFHAIIRIQSIYFHIMKYTVTYPEVCSVISIVGLQTLFLIGTSTLTIKTKIILCFHVVSLHQQYTLMLTSFSSFEICIHPQETCLYMNYSKVAKYSMLLKKNSHYLIRTSRIHSWNVYKYVMLLTMLLVKNTQL